MKSELLRPDNLVKLYIQNVSKDRVTSATYQSYGFPLFDMRKTENICNKESKWRVTLPDYACKTTKTNSTEAGNM